MPTPNLIFNFIFPYTKLLYRSPELLLQIFCTSGLILFLVFVLVSLRDNIHCRAFAPTAGTNPIRKDSFVRTDHSLAGKYCQIRPMKHEFCKDFVRM